MCHQAVGLIQSEIEGRGIATASITMLPEITRKVRPPRSLEVPFPLGYPLGESNTPMMHKAILRQLLMLTKSENIPVLNHLSLDLNKLNLEMATSKHKEVAA